MSSGDCGATRRIGGHSPTTSCGNCSRAAVDELASGQRSSAVADDSMRRSNRRGARHIGRPPNVAKHPRAGSEPIDRKGFVLRIRRRRVEWMCFVDTIQRLDERVALFEIRDDRGPKARKHSRIRIELGKNVRQLNLRVHEARLESRMERAVRCIPVGVWTGPTVVWLTMTRRREFTMNVKLSRGQGRVSGSDGVNSGTTLAPRQTDRATVPYPRPRARAGSPRFHARPRPRRRRSPMHSRARSLPTSPESCPRAA